MYQAGCVNYDRRSNFRGLTNALCDGGSKLEKMAHGRDVTDKADAIGSKL
jgi:hypothetical protein